MLGFAALGQGRHTSERNPYRRGRASLPRGGGEDGARSPNCLASWRWRRRTGAITGARSGSAERGLALSREVGERQAISSCALNLATLAQAEGDHERAGSCFERG